MLNRRMIIAALSVVMLAACANSAPVDGTGRPLEKLVVETATGKHDFMVEIADDETERQRGLMFREPLADDRGMLFQFPDVAPRSFWMRNTPSSLDIIFIAPNGRILNIAANTQTNSDQNYLSNGSAAGVLEVRAGRMAEIGAKAGDTVRHPFFGN